MYVEELTIWGYGKLSNFRLEPSTGLNVLYGSTAVGKTTVCNCLRDLLLGPGRWESAEGGPRAPYARPWTGDRFQARVRYRIADKTYTLQRNFDEQSCRVRDDQAATEIPMPDPTEAAPGIRTTRLDETPSYEVVSLPDAACVRLQDAQARAASADREAVTWAWHYLKALVLDLEGRLSQGTAIERELESLRPQLVRYERFALLKSEDRDAMIRDGARLHSLEQEIEQLSREVEGLKESRRQIGLKLSACESFYTVTQDDLETIKNLEIAESTSFAPLEEKQKNLAGFRAKESDIGQRLEEIGTRFSNVDSDEDFELRLNEHEREVGRSELLTSRVVERDRNQTKIDALHAASHRDLGSAVFCLALSVALTLVAFAMNIGREGQLAGLAVAVLSLVIAMLFFVKKHGDDHAREELVSENARVVGEIDKLKSTIDISREQLRLLLDAAGVKTIRELRMLYREYRSLQRDAATVLAYRTELERDLAALRSELEATKVATPRLLITSGIVKEGETLTPRAVADFFEAYHRFLAMQQEEENAKKRFSQLQSELVEKKEERDRLQASRDRALQAMGLTSESELDAAFSGRSEFDQARAQIDVLEEKLRAVLQGHGREEVASQLDEARASLGTLDVTHVDLPSTEVSPDRLNEYRDKMIQAQKLAATASGEIAALQATLSMQVPTAEGTVQLPPRPDGPSVGPDGGPPTSGPTSRKAEELELRVAEVWRRINGSPVHVRIGETAGRFQIEVRAGAGTPWLPAVALGSAGARLLDTIVRGESSCAENLPVFLDNPFMLLDAACEERLAEWLVELADGVQMFVTLSSAEARDSLRQVLQNRGVPVTETREDDLEILSAAAQAHAIHP